MNRPIRDEDYTHFLLNSIPAFKEPVSRVRFDEDHKEDSLEEMERTNRSVIKGEKSSLLFLRKSPSVTLQILRSASLWSTGVMRTEHSIQECYI